MPFIARGAFAALCACAAILVAISLVLPLNLGSQLAFGAVFVAAAAAAVRLRSRYATALLCLLTLFTSTRYMLWRATHTLDFDNPAGWTLGIGLFMAECYTWVVMVLSFTQSAWPLQRPMTPLRGAPATAPKVDVYIPSYNEPLSVVAPTVLAAMEMDYPKDRFRVFLLDDGKRAEFEAFAQQAGCEYITRSDNHHAKAGNLNEAMKVTNGELICIFDCDHVPTRGFLQMTVGWFQTDPKLALLQTPHFFYSPDPVQRNLRMERDLPGEGDLFYDTLQSGNDLWNAAFFCGSCAVIRREALDSVGGFAFETVTEDAHTALKIHRKGWNSAFINLRLSAGLATETLNQHIGQRVRWCRGMTQILRLDNPLFGRGLSIPQRLCYLNALLYYQFPLVRVIFLVSPLAYLLFGVNLISAPAALLAAYAVPHIILSQISNQRLQGRVRGMLWGEIYETILAFHLVRPALVSLFSPRGGKFNVTDKGQLLENGFFDLDLVRPHLITAGLLMAGMAFAVAKLWWPEVFDMHWETLVLNGVWTGVNLLILFVAIAVGREARQIRAQVRRPIELPAILYFDDGRVVDVVTENASAGGLAVTAPATAWAAGRKVVEVSLPVPGGYASFPVHEVARVGDSLRLQFEKLDIEQTRQLVRALMGRVDAWQPEPRPAHRAAWLTGLGEVARTSASTAAFVAHTGRRKLQDALAARTTAALLAAAILTSVAVPDIAHAAASDIVVRLDAWTAAADLAAAWLEERPALLALGVIGGLAAFAGALVMRLKVQVRRRLGDLAERQR